DLVKSCYFSSGRFTYTTIGQSIKQQNSERNALRTREIVLRSPISIPLRITAEGGALVPRRSATAPLRGTGISIRAFYNATGAAGTAASRISLVPDRAIAARIQELFSYRYWNPI